MNINIGDLVSHLNAPGKVATVLEVVEGVAKVAYEHKDAITGAVTAITHGHYNVGELVVAPASDNGQSGSFALPA